MTQPRRSLAGERLSFFFIYKRRIIIMERETNIKVEGKISSSNKVNTQKENVEAIT